MDAFVILPFEDEFEDLYNEIIAPTLENEGYDVNKADELESQRAIIQDIINGITNADLIIADLTGTNPNVLYELGIAHGMGVPTMLIAQDIGELPFDLSAYKTIEYSLIFSEIEEFEAELTEVGEGHINDSIEFGSPVSDYGDVEISHDIIQEDEGSDSPAIQESSDNGDQGEDGQLDKGVLEYASEIDNEISELEDIFAELEQESEKLEESLRTHSQEIQSISMDGPQSRKRANKVARQMGKSISDFSSAVEEYIQPVEEKFNFIMKTFESFIKFADASDEEDREELKSVRQDLEGFIKDLDSEIEEIDGFQQEASQMKGLSRELDKSINDLNSTITDYETVLDEGVAKSERYKSLIDKKVDNVD